MFSNAMKTIEKAIKVPIRGEKSIALEALALSLPQRVIECAIVNDVTIGTKAIRLRNRNYET